MNDLDKEAIALWKYGLIAPMISNSHGFKSHREYCIHLASTPQTNPVTGKSKMYSPNTFKNWYWLFSAGGVKALFPQSRSDLGKSRRLTTDAQDEIAALLTEYQRAPNTIIREKLLEIGIIDASISQSTVDRFIKMLRGKQSVELIHQGKDRKAFEFAHACDCWQADTTFLRNLDGKKVCLMLIVDDASRMVTGWGIFFEDNAINFLSVLKKAISIYGKPSLLYMDNGAPYRNKHLDWTCAQLGVQIAHTPVRDGAAKGKTERLNRTLKTRWMNGLNWKEFKDIEEIKQSFQTYLNTDYHISAHTSLKDPEGRNISPKERFMQDRKRFKKVSLEVLDEAFLYHETRNVKTDSTIQIRNISFDIPSEYMKEKIDVFYDPLNLDSIWFKPQNDEQRYQAFQTNKYENRKTKRKQHISFSGEED